jgi:hypothetical protein
MHEFALMGDEHAFGDFFFEVKIESIPSREVQQKGGNIHSIEITGIDR